MTERINSPFFIANPEREHPSAVQGGDLFFLLFPALFEAEPIWKSLRETFFFFFFLAESTKSLKPQLLGEVLITEKPFLSRTCASERLWLCLAVTFGAVAPQNSKYLSFQSWDILVQVPDPFPRPESRNNFELCS